MKVVQPPAFQRIVKKLHANQKMDLDEAVRALMQSPMLGEEKKGDLKGLRVYKFRMVGQLTLLAYRLNEELGILYLEMLGSHENFYRNLKN